MQLYDNPDASSTLKRLHKHGIEALMSYELLGFILANGSCSQTELKVAKRILDQYTIEGLVSLPLEKLASIEAMGKHRAAVLLSMKYLLQFVKADEPQPITKPSEVSGMMAYLAGYEQEHLVALYLDTRYHLLDKRTIGIGIVNSVLIHPREVFAPATEKRASGVILIHNHPSQETTPSSEDVKVTQKLVDAGDLLDIPLLDHLIITKKGWKSLKQEGLL